MIKTSLILFFIVSVIFSTIYTPQAILPTLQKSFNLSMTQTNLLLSGMIFVLMVATPLYAPIVRRFEKKKIMMVTIFLLSMAVFLSAFSSNYYWLLLSRVMQGLFVPGITAIMLSYVQDIYPQEQRGLGMGIYMASTGFGAVMGRFLAGWITYSYSWREAFVFFAILLLIALLSMAWGLPSIGVRVQKSSIKKEALLSYLMDVKILSIVLIPMVVFFSFMATSIFVTYHLSKAPFFLNERDLGTLFLIMLFSVVASPLAGRYSDKIGRVKILFLALFLLMLGMVLTLSSSLLGISMGIGLVTIGMFSVQSVTPTYLGDLVPDDRATVAVLYQTFFYMGGALGTLLPVLAWDYGGYDGVVWLCLGLLLFGVSPVVYMILKRKMYAK